ncbi:uncharacterized protein LOC134452735 isoform X2 [Engraulis encrasicolus]|uniref:uncharacterized protein LOC134452735 isoform X2 n=1 Tax=Engraulis encrasicolus TaxID=184585 RepID=UPI002FD283F3
MWFFCFLACCWTAGQDRNAKLTRKLTKKVNRYTLDQLWRKVKSLGIHVAEDKLRKDEQSMRNLRMLLITELAMAELFKTGTELKGKRKKKSDADAENGNVTNGVQTITAAEGELEEGLRVALAETEVQQLVDMDTMAIENVENGAGERAGALGVEKQAGGTIRRADGPVLLRLPAAPRKKFSSIPTRRNACSTPINRYYTIPRSWAHQWADISNSGL